MGLGSFLCHVRNDDEGAQEHSPYPQNYAQKSLKANKHLITYRVPSQPAHDDDRRGRDMAHLINQAHKM